MTTAGIEPVLRRSGPPPAPQTEALLSWVVREAVTNVVRHARATTCSFVLDGVPGRVRLTATDDGPGPVPPRAGPDARAGERGPGFTAARSPV